MLTKVDSLRKSNKEIERERRAVSLFVRTKDTLAVFEPISLAIIVFLMSNIYCLACG